MTRRSVAWVLAFPIAAGGLIGGHELAWRIAVPNSSARARDLVQSGNGYSEHVTLVLGLCLAAVLLAFGLRAYAAFRGRRAGGIPPAAFALLPPLAFLLREQIERVASGSDLFPGVLTDRIFLIGFLVQVPLGLVLLCVARALEALATSVGCVLADRRTRLVARTLELGFARHGVIAPPLPVLARGYGERAPPRLR